MRPTARLLAAIVTCAVIASCAQATQPLPSADQPTQSSRAAASTAGVNQYPQITGPEHSLHLEADVEVTPRVFVAGSTIEITVRVRNTTHELQAVSRCPIVYAFYDESGKNVGPFFVCGSEDFVIIPAGETFEKKFTQVGYWAPGRYKVYPSVSILPLQHPFSVEILSPTP